MSTNPPSFRLPTAYQIPTHIEHNGEQIRVPQQIQDNVRMLFNGLLDAHQALQALNTKVGEIQPGTTTVTNNVTNVTTGATLPTFNTSGQGYFFGPGIFLPISAISRGSGSSWEPAINRVNVCQFIMPVNFQVSIISFNVIAGSIGDFAGFGIYSADGNTLLVDSGPVSVSANGVKTVTIGSVQLTAGTTYNWAQTCSTQTCTINTSSSVGLNDANLMNANAGAPRYATAANSSIAGQLPATLGALTAVTVLTVFDTALVMLEP